MVCVCACVHARECDIAVGRCAGRKLGSPLERRGGGDSQWWAAISPEGRRRERANERASERDRETETERQRETETERDRDREVGCRRDGK